MKMVIELKETNAERLGRCFEQFHKQGWIFDKDVGWLIEQVRQSQRLEDENVKLREALKFYADNKTYTDDRQHTSTGQLVHTGYTAIQCDTGKTARKALEDSE